MDNYDQRMAELASRNIDLRLQKFLLTLELQKLKTELANWQQIAIASVEKIKILERNSTIR